MSGNRKGGWEGLEGLLGTWTGGAPLPALEMAVDMCLTALKGPSTGYGKNKKQIGGGWDYGTCGHFLSPHTDTHET